MANRIPLLTDWVTIARSGATADGRSIEPEWLTDMAKSYDPAEYTAVVNNEHLYGNLGTVRELRTVKAPEGRIDLQARIEVNKYYLAKISESAGLFFSVEITHNFADSGKPYLTGLASTDNPASLGTTELHFSKASTPEHFITAPIAAEMRIGSRPDENGDGTAAGSFAEQLTAALKSFFTTNRKDDDMDPKELADVVKNAVKGGLEEFAKTQGKDTPDNAEFAKLKTKFDELKTEFEATKNELAEYKKKLDEALKTNNNGGIAPDTGDAGNKHEELI